MNIIDIVCILIIVLFTLYGVKRGIIKQGISLLGFIAVLVIAYELRLPVSDFLISKLPFFDFAGSFRGITAINVLLYQLIAFLVIFIVLYCVLSILMSLSGIIEKLIEKNLILAIPSKILGGMLGFIEGTIVTFLFVFVAIHFSFTTEIVGKSRLAVITLERTPVISSIALNTSLAMEDISRIVSDTKNNENREDANFKVLHTLLYYKIIDSGKAQKLIEDQKIRFKSTVIV